MHYHDSRTRGHGVSPYGVSVDVIEHVTYIIGELPLPSWHHTFGDGQEGAIGRLALAVRSAADQGVPIRVALRPAVEGSPAVFADVQGRLLYRALMLER